MIDTDSIKTMPMRTIISSIRVLPIFGFDIIGQYLIIIKSIRYVNYIIWQTNFTILQCRNMRLLDSFKHVP